jgi:tetratricopeptide (TPR) repeat protein
LSLARNKQKCLCGLELALRIAMGDLAAVRGRYEEAEAHYRAALARNPQSPSALNNLAWLLALHDGKGAEALDCIQRAIAILGPLPALLDTRAVVLMALGQADAALKDLELVAAESPTPVRSFRLARAYHLAHRPDKARTILTEATGKDGLRPDALDPLERPIYDKLCAALAE